MIHFLISVDSHIHRIIERLTKSRKEIKSEKNSFQTLLEITYQHVQLPKFGF